MASGNHDDVVFKTKLNKDNFFTWKTQLSFALKAKGIGKILTQNRPATGDAEQDKYDQNTGKAQNIIYQTLSEEDKLFVTNYHDTAKQMYDRLCSKYESSHRTRIADLYQELFSPMYGDIEEICQKVRSIFIALLSLNANEKFEEMFIYVCLSKYVGRPNMDVFIQQIKSQEESLKKYEDFEKRVSEYARSMANSTENVVKNEAPLSFNIHRKFYRKFCNHCKVGGHQTERCWIKNPSLRRYPAQKSSSNALVQQPKSTAQQSSTSAQQSSSNKSGPFSSVISLYVNSKFNKNKWIIDTGTRYHSTPDLSLLNNYTEEILPVKTGGGISQYLGYGEVRGYVKGADGSMFELHLSKVYYFPSSPVNLIATRQLKAGMEMRFTEDNCDFYVDGVKKASAPTHTDTDLYELELHALPEANCMNVHEDLGHPSDSTVKNMIKNNVMKGLKTAEKSNCEPCLRGNLKDIPHKKKIANFNHLEAGNYWHMDIGGYDEVSTSGNRYFLLAKCERTKFLKIYLMRNRSETTSAIKKLINQVKIETGNNVCHIHSDAGTEFVSNNVKEILNENGITSTQATPGCPQQNGSAERSMQSILKQLKINLNAANLSNKFWDEALNYSVFSFNRQTSRGVVTPFEAYFKIKPNITDSIAFGTYGYVKLDSKGLSKYDMNAVEARFLGYSPGSTTVKRCLIQKNNVKIIKNSSIFQQRKDFDFGELESSEDEQDYVQENVPNKEEPENEEESENEDEINLLENTPKKEESKIEDEEKKSKSKSKKKKRKYKKKIHVQSEERMETLRSHKNLSLNIIPVPSNYKQAVTGEDAEKWKEAMLKEMKSQEEHNTWTLVEKKDQQDIISVKWIFKIKQTEDDIIYKARLVAQGYRQDSSPENYSPVVKHQTVKLFLSLAAHFKLKIDQFDVSTAFLNGVLKNNIFVKQPEGFNTNNNMICKLNKGLYGLKESPRTWFLHFKEIIMKFGLKQSLYDSCLFYSDHIITIIYVDDGLIMGKDEDVMALKDHLNKSLKLKWTKLSNFLGMKIVQNQDHSIDLSMTKYIENIVKTFNIPTRSRKVPLPNNFKILDGEEIIHSENYRKLLGSLLYLSTHARPDITFAISYLSKFANKPTESAYKALIQVAEYCNTTKDLKISYCSSSKLNIETFTDSTFNSFGRSYYGVLVKLNGPVLWLSKQSSKISTSSNDAELTACSEAARLTKGIMNILEELKIKFERPTILTDNLGVKNALSVGETPLRLGHIENQRLYAVELSRSGEATYKWISTHDQPADALTKPVSGTILKILKENCFKNI